MRAETFDLPLRVVVRDPIPGVALALQEGASGKARLAPPASRSTEALAFESDVAVDGALGDGRPGCWDLACRDHRRRGSSISASDRRPARLRAPGAVA